MGLCDPTTDARMHTKSQWHSHTGTLTRANAYQLNAWKRVHAHTMRAHSVHTHTHTHTHTDVAGAGAAVQLLHGSVLHAALAAAPATVVLTSGQSWTTIWLRDCIDVWSGRAEHAQHAQRHGMPTHRSADGAGRIIGRVVD